ncbi:MAG TPA: acyltransferase, partial [Rubellimicrobium sp.]|nr:acyltransferase [Rubellimicrobium sp.]
VQPFRQWVDYELGTMAVFAFFAISGFLVTYSFERQPTIQHWALARILRIFPGLLVVLLLTVFALGPMVTSLPLTDYLRDPATWSYVPTNLSLAFHQSALPGVFEAAPRGPELNGSLWTLYYEVLCYGLVLALGLAGAFRSRRVLMVAAGLYLLANVAWVLLPVEWPETLWALRWLSAPFACGVAFHLARNWLPLTPWLLLVMAVAAYGAHGTQLYEPLFVLALSYAVFLLAYLPRGWVRRYNRLGDYSYGVYIYAWPVQQTALHSFGRMSPVQNILISVPVALGLAWLSWNLVEKPALGLLPTRSGGGGGP